ncbi:MAG: hypothetical protein ACXW2O_09035 [Candidatus Aminicenantales bacterium]
MAVAVGIRPQGEVPLFKQLYGKFFDWNLDDGRIPFIKDPSGKKELSEDEKKKGDEKGKDKKVLFRKRAGGGSIRGHEYNVYQKMGFISNL